jgi:hypothetical protein
VNIGSEDRRRPISSYPEVFPPAVQAGLNRISGRITCEIGDYEYSGEARIIEDDSQIITVGHVFSAKGRGITDPLPECLFVTKANPDRKIPIDIDAGRFVFGSRQPRSHKRLDFALARLKQPVRDAVIPKFGVAPKVGETVYMVSSEADGMTHRTDPRQLVAQDCTVRFAAAREEALMGYFTTDCSSLPGESGSIYYAIRNGAIETVGFEVGGGFASANGKPYDVWNPDPKLRSFSLGLIFDQSLLDESRSLAMRAKSLVRRSGKSISEAERAVPALRDNPR